MVAPKTDQELRNALVRRQLQDFLVSSALDSDVTYLLSRYFEAELLLQERVAEIMDKIYQQPDFEFLRLFKEVDRASSGEITQHNLQVFLNNAGIYNPNAHIWLFRRCSPRKNFIDVNDFRRIFDVYGKGILGTANKYALSEEHPNE